MELAGTISSPDMESIAISHLDVDIETVKTIDDGRRGNKIMFNFDLLKKWRDKSTENNLEVEFFYVCTLICQSMVI